MKNGGGSYPYDATGRMTRNGHRGLTITYNHLDLPATITKDGVVTTILYDASGRNNDKKVELLGDASEYTSKAFKNGTPTPEYYRN